MGLFASIFNSIGSKAEEKGVTPSARVEAKSAWQGRYARNHRLFESERAYQIRTGDKKPSSWW